jgi:integrase
VNDGEVRVETPKTARSVRSIALSSVAADALRRWRKVQLEERLQWGAAYQDSGYVFTRENGEPIDLGR